MNLDQEISYLKSNKSYQNKYLSKLQSLNQKVDKKIEINPGLISSDNSSIIGRDEWIYIYLGSNKFLSYFTGRSQLSDEEIYQWKKTLQSRINWHKTKNIDYTHLFVPNKLAIYPEFFHKKIDIESDRPIIQLQKACGDLFVYPTEHLSRNKDIYRVYEKQNSYWSFWGCFLVYELLCRKLGITPNLELLEYPIKTLTEQGDLGIKFNLQETRLHKQIKFKSSVAYDNKLINFCNRGSIRILKNPEAISGKMLIFGDSFSNPGYPNYLDHKRHAHRLTSLFAETIREVHFIWSARIDYEYIEREKPDFVLTEMAERFLIKVPQDDSKLSIQQYAHLKLKKYETERKKGLNKQLAEIEKQLQVCIKRGNKLKKQGNLDRSIVDYQKAIAIKPDSIQPLQKLGEIYETQKNWVEAIKCYRRIVGLNYNSPGAYIKLARALNKQNKIYGANSQPTPKRLNLNQIWVLVFIKIMEICCYR